MKKLKNILLLGSFLLAGCRENPNLLTEENFTNAEWADVPYTGEIWTSYMGEGIPKSNKNWKMYQVMTAQRNGFRYVEKNGLTYMVKVKGKAISLPDLDGNGFIKYSKIDSVKVEQADR